MRKGVSKYTPGWFIHFFMPSNFSLFDFVTHRHNHLSPDSNLCRNRSRWLNVCCILGLKIGYIGLRLSPIWQYVKIFDIIMIFNTFSNEIVLTLEVKDLNGRSYAGTWVPPPMTKNWLNRTTMWHNLYVTETLYIWYLKYLSRLFIPHAWGINSMIGPKSL